jgi:hypothetical protein
MSRGVIAALSGFAFIIAFLVTLSLIKNGPPSSAPPPTSTAGPYPYQAALKLAVAKRERYRDELDKIFLKSGFDIKVWLEDATTTYDGLRLLGPFSRPSVYHVATSMHNLDDPRQLGFATVEFNSTVGEGK